MSTSKKKSDEKQRIKKMTKAQMQLAIIKKKRCDAHALAIVEQLLEPGISPDWLLKNLGFISKCHMEDVIEERAITKLCGYVLCTKPLTVIIRQQYHISTRTNKVFDISRRKNFCSSSCYGATNYLLEQMLDSPLWLREKDDIPIFQILSILTRPKHFDDVSSCASLMVVSIFINMIGTHFYDKKLHLLHDTDVLVKILVNTFNLSPANIVFNPHQWKLVELIVIKMIDLIDAQLQSEQVSKFITNILESYNLDSNYLDRLIMEVTNRADASSSNDKQC